MRSLILSLLVLQLLLPGAFSESDVRKPKPVMCKNPKAKEGSSTLLGCSTATCRKAGKKGVWQQCPPLAREETVLENQRKIDRNHELLKDILEILGQPNCCPTIETTTWAPASTTVEGCPADWSLYESSCYRLYTKQVSWEQAQAECKKENSNLASILDDGTKNFIASLQSTNRIWIGAYNDGNGGWQWVDKSRWSYENWSGNEPSGDGARVEMYETNNEWNDIRGSVGRAFVCKQ